MACCRSSQLQRIRGKCRMLRSSSWRRCEDGGGQLAREAGQHRLGLGAERDQFLAIFGGQTFLLTPTVDCTLIKVLADSVKCSSSPRPVGRGRVEVAVAVLPWHRPGRGRHRPARPSRVPSRRDGGGWPALEQRAGWPQGIAPLGLPQIRTCTFAHTAPHIMSSLRDGSLSESALRLVPDAATVVVSCPRFWVSMHPPCVPPTVT